jgi:hypothetical protein
MKMNFYEDDKYENIMEEITDVMGYLVLDIILSSLKKIHAENQIFGEVLESKLEVKTDKYPQF